MRGVTTRRQGHAAEGHGGRTLTKCSRASSDWRKLCIWAAKRLNSLGTDMSGGSVVLEMIECSTVGYECAEGSTLGKGLGCEPNANRTRARRWDATESLWVGGVMRQSLSCLAFSTAFSPNKARNGWGRGRGRGQRLLRAGNSGGAWAPRYVAGVAFLATRRSCPVHENCGASSRRIATGWDCRRAETGG